MSKKKIKPLFKDEAERQKILDIYAKEERKEKLNFHERNILKIYLKNYQKHERDKANRRGNQ